MDAIDAALMEAWGRVMERVRRDPAEGARRVARTRGKMMQRPMRAWCLCVRASDTRFAEKRWIVRPEHAEERYPPHRVWLGCYELRDVVRPVNIDWPGRDWTIAAQMLGRHPVSLRGWMKRGVFKVSRVNARSIGKIGNPVPFVYAMSPLDPNAEFGRAPASVWGDAWMGFHEKVPESFEQVLFRVPHMRKYKQCEEERFRGWEFVCRGRLLAIERGATEEQRHAALEEQRETEPHARLEEIEGRWYVRVPCGRKVDLMFCPLPVWTLQRSLDIRESGAGQDAAERLGLDDTVMPGMENWGDDPHARSFACARCWKVRYGTLTNRQGWNEFVSHLSGGLLCGKDVARPAETRVREAAYVPVRNRRIIELPSATRERRARVVRLLGEGERISRIGKRVGVRNGTILTDVRAIYRAHGVRTRAQLRDVLDRTRGTPEAHDP